MPSDPCPPAPIARLEEAARLVRACTHFLPAARPCYACLALALERERALGRAEAIAVSALGWRVVCPDGHVAAMGDATRTVFVADADDRGQSARVELRCPACGAATFPEDAL